MTLFPPSWLAGAALGLGGAAPARCQNGDVPGEVQAALAPELEVPAAPARDPAAELATFRAAGGFRVELVAAEPLVRDPVALAFDQRGRIWVVEMSGFMPDLDGRGENDPAGTIAVLTDHDGDGRSDERRIFLDGLVLPRAVLPTRGGALVLAPPELWFCSDEDQDGAADRRELVDGGFSAGLLNPEHAANGLMPALDNWIRCANHALDYRWRAGAWERRGTAGGGQWGISQDDAGRIFFNTNSDPLRGDLVSSHYTVRNPNLGRAAGANVALASDLRVFPGRVTPGVNRGYRPGFLVDGKLKEFTAACGPVIYRGDQFPGEYRGNAFVCEPAANLIKRYVLEETGGGALVARCPELELDFLTSGDERFRPVNLHNGPDGALYVVDFYRGVIQHRMFLTTFLRHQAEERGLDRPIGRGRIWRVVHEAGPQQRPVDLGSAGPAELAQALSHANGWVRDTAQRLLVEEHARRPRAAAEVQEQAWKSSRPLARLHALWALEGMGGASVELVLEALADPDPAVAAAAVRLAEPFLAAAPPEELLRCLEVRAGAGDFALRRQILLSLGQSHHLRCRSLALAVLQSDASSRELREAALSGFGGRELAVIEALVEAPEWRGSRPGREALLQELARCVAREGRSDRLLELVELCGAPGGSPWQQQALQEGLLAGRPRTATGRPGYFFLPRPPAPPGPPAQLAACLAWPGKEGVEVEVPPPLSAAEQALFERGRAHYAAACASCHLASGLGEPGKAPPLRQSEWVLGPEQRLARIVLHGLRGPMRAAGEDWDGEMPAYAASDGELAAILTYVRREWGHGASAVAAEQVRAVREQSSRSLPWSAAELLAEETRRLPQGH